MQSLNETIRRRYPIVPQKPSELLVGLAFTGPGFVVFANLPSASSWQQHKDIGSVSLLYHNFC